MKIEINMFSNEKQIIETNKNDKKYLSKLVKQLAKDTDIKNIDVQDETTGEIVYSVLNLSFLIKGKSSVKTFVIVNNFS